MRKIMFTLAAMLTTTFSLTAQTFFPGFWDPLEPQCFPCQDYANTELTVKHFTAGNFKVINSTMHSYNPYRFALPPVETSVDKAHTAKYIIKNPYGAGVTLWDVNQPVLIEKDLATSEPPQWAPYANEIISGGIGLSMELTLKNGKPEPAAHPILSLSCGMALHGPSTPGQTEPSYKVTPNQQMMHYVWVYWSGMTSPSDIFIDFKENPSSSCSVDYQDVNDPNHTSPYIQWDYTSPGAQIQDVTTGANYQPWGAGYTIDPPVVGWNCIGILYTHAAY